MAAKTLSENRRARHDYAIESDLEVGLILLGSEVKSLRRGGSNIADSYATIENGELWLMNGYIAPLEHGGIFGHEPRRKRKLLASRREIARLWSATAREGLTLVPLRLYANERGVMKLSLAVARGKKKADKREASAARDWNRQKARLLKTASRL
ncbi:SsrA-binding protein SmpB [Defluviimonas salinarum]|uniref:SsrA-binding protein n=1 Tax=Defluviimonas salinarum TaxID=2992147 RepID=A0ABT3J870_9RHOB|nr:SsrA-binding protein SmpB [Defluviimonas salinarum]MCW3783888.1 SsrA-binding protein SmpB [Defluviimonas salinarum]